MKKRCHVTHAFRSKLHATVEGVVAQRWEIFQPLRTTLHTIENSELKALRALNIRWALPVYPVFDDGKSN